MGMELMYAIFGGIILVFVLVLISCRLSLKPYKELIGTLNKRIMELEKQLAKAESRPRNDKKKETED